MGVAKGSARAVCSILEAYMPQVYLTCAFRGVFGWVQMDPNSASKNTDSVFISVLGKHRFGYFCFGGWGSFNHTGVLVNHGVHASLAGFGLTMAL